MKKYIYGMALVLSVVTLFTSCKDEEGTEPGTDSTPVATLFQETVTSGMNADNDVLLRVATNSAVQSVYYLAVDSATYKQQMATSGVDGFNDYVVEHGTLVDSLGANSSKDVAIRGMEGDYVITFVAVNGNTKHASTFGFTGLMWETIAVGTYYCQPQDDGTYSMERFIKLGKKENVNLQKCSNVANTYQFKDLFGTSQGMKFSLYDGPFKDSDGNEYYQVHVALNNTGFSHSKYGDIFVRDVATWQNNNSYMDYNRYYPASNEVELYLEYGVSAGYFSYGSDYFIPNN